MYDVKNDVSSVLIMNAGFGTPPPPTPALTEK